MKKLRENHGESLVEILAAFALFLLALTMLTAMVTMGLRLNRMAAKADNAYYGDFEEADGKLTVSVIQSFTAETPEDREIPYYRNEAGLLYFCFDAAPPTDAAETP